MSDVKSKTESKATAKEADPDPYLDWIQQRGTHDHVMNDYRPPREAKRRFMLSRVEPEVMLPPEDMGLIPPEEAKKAREKLSTQDK